MWRKKLPIQVNYANLISERLLHKLYVNEVTLSRQNLPLKSNHSQMFMASNFVALWPTDPKFSALKDLLFFLQRIEFQGADSILKVNFALSCRPHLHRAYVVTVCNQIWIAVSVKRMHLLQSLNFAYIRLLNKPYENEVTLTG